MNMATGVRIDPYRNFRFRVEIDGVQAAAFSEASIPSMDTQEVPYREGTDPAHSRKLSGMNSFGNVSLKRGLTDSTELYAWYEQVQKAGAEGARRNISLVLLDDKGNDRARWDIVDAWPLKYESGGFNASGNEVMIETIEIVHEGVQRVA